MPIAAGKHIADASCNHATIIFLSGTHRLVGDSALLRHRLGMSANHEESTSTSSRSIRSPLRRHRAAGTGDAGNGCAGAYCADTHASRVSSIAPGGPESSGIPKHRSASASASIGGCRCHGCDAPLRAGGCPGQTTGCPSGQDQFRFTLPGLESERSQGFDRQVSARIWRSEPPAHRRRHCRDQPLPRDLELDADQAPFSKTR